MESKVQTRTVPALQVTGYYYYEGGKATMAGSLQRMDKNGSGQGQVASTCVCFNETSGSINGGEFS